MGIDSMGPLAKQLLEAIRDVETSHEQNPSTDELTKLVSNLKSLGFLAPRNRPGAYLLRDSGHGSPVLFVGALGVELIFVSLPFAQACRFHYPVLSPHSKSDKLQILQIIE